MLCIQHTLGGEPLSEFEVLSHCANPSLTARYSFSPHKYPACCLLVPIIHDFHQLHLIDQDSLLSSIFIISAKITSLIHGMSSKLEVGATPHPRRAPSMIQTPLRGYCEIDDALLLRLDDRPNHIATFTLRYGYKNSAQRREDGFPSFSSSSFSS